MLLNAGPGASGIPFLKLSSLLLSKGITGVRFAEHQRCFIRTQTRSLPTATEVVAEDTALPVRLPLPTPPTLGRRTNPGPVYLILSPSQ